MKGRMSTINAICLISVISLAAVPQICSAAISLLTPEIIDIREMSFFDDMKPRNAEYESLKTQFGDNSERVDWKLKIHPFDLQYYNSNKESTYIEVYVSEKEDNLIDCEDFTGNDKITFRVYTASEQAVKNMAEIPNTYFYASRFSPSVCMTVSTQSLKEIASNPSVYCIRIIPSLTPFLSMIDEIPIYNDIEYTMQYHDSTLDASTHIVVIGSGYDPNDSYFGGDANDNIMPSSSWDWTDSNIYVNDDANVHESSVTDTMVNTFGDFSQTDYSMYENRNFWTPLKICDDSYSTANQYASQAIEWCVAHQVDIVCMAFGVEPPIMWNVCDGWWCDRLRAGTLTGTTWVCAAGNAGHTNGVAYPAESHWAVAVGAYDYIPAQRLDMQGITSDYGYATYATELWGYQYFCTPCYWYGPQEVSEFKPNAYECGYLGYWGWGAGTSYSAPIACADIAIGIYSPNGGQYTQGYEYLLDVIDLCNEYPVSPSACSLRGDVIDTHTLWHRQVVAP